MNETEILDMLTRYAQAERDLLQGKNVMWGNKLLQRENLSENPQRSAGVGAEISFNPAWRSSFAFACYFQLRLTHEITE